MLNQSVWWMCITLEVSLLARGMRARLLQTFPLFYSYIFLVLITDLISTPIYRYHASVYPSFYWATELLLAATSYGVLAEIYSQSLKNYPGVARFFRILLLIMFFAVATKVVASSLSTAHMSFGRAVADLGRNVRELQAVLLCGLLGLFAYYKIAAEKNLRGLVVGYSLVVTSEVVTLTFAFYPAAGFDLFMRKIEPVIYGVCLLIWLSALWVSQPEVAPEVPCGIERDYERLSRETRMAVIRARAHVARAVRS